MKNFNSKLYWILYIVGMCICVSAIFFSNGDRLKLILAGAVLILIPLISIIVEVAKSSIKEKVNWIYFLLFFSGIAIPYYLATRKRRLAELQVK